MCLKLCKIIIIIIIIIISNEINFLNCLNFFKCLNNAHFFFAPFLPYLWIGEWNSK